MPAFARSFASNSRRSRDRSASRRCMSPMIRPKEGSVVLGLRPEDAVLTQAPGDNVICACVTARHYLGDAFLYQACSGGIAFEIRRPKAEQLELGTEIFVHLPPSACMAFRGGADKAVGGQEDLSATLSSPASGG